MKNKLNILFACLYLLTNVLSAGQVMCSGADGHKSIEKLHISNHCPTSHDDHNNHQHEEHEHSDHTHDVVNIEDHCEPCVDTPLQGDAKFSDLNQKTFLYGIFECSSTKVVAIDYNYISVIFIPLQLPRSDQLLANLRTIILII